MATTTPTRSAPAARAQRESAAAGGRSSGRGEQLRQDPWGEAANRRRRKRLAAFKALDLLRTFSSLERVRKCRRVKIGNGPVHIRHRRDEARAHYAGVQTCGSVWSCPCCSERILTGRAEELVTAVRTHAATGGDVLMLTLTMRHHSGQALADLWDALGEAWRAASSGSRSVRSIMGPIDWVRRVEATYGEHGWHVHVHALLFVPAATDPEPVGQTVFAAWARRLVGLGLEAPLDGPGMRIKRLDLSQASAEVADYLAKGSYEEATDARRAALELAANGKQARAGNRTPFDILADFVADGQATDAELWGEWEKGSKGRRAITWSRGARARLVPTEELSDEELAQESDGGGEVVALIEDGAWPAIIAQPRLANLVLNLVETADDADDAYERVDRALAGAGLRDALRRPPPAAPEWEP